MLNFIIKEILTSQNTNKRSIIVEKPNSFNLFSYFGFLFAVSHISSSLISQWCEIFLVPTLHTPTPKSVVVSQNVIRISGIGQYVRYESKNVSGYARIEVCMLYMHMYIHTYVHIRNSIPSVQIHIYVQYKHT